MTTKRITVYGTDTNGRRMVLFEEDVSVRQTKVKETSYKVRSCGCIRKKYYVSYQTESTNNTYRSKSYN